MSANTRAQLEEDAELRRRLRALGSGPTNPSKSDELEQLRADRVAASLEAELRLMVRRRTRVRASVSAALALAAAVLLAFGYRGRTRDRAMTIAQENLPRVPSLQETAASLPTLPTAARSVEMPVREPSRRATPIAVVPPSAASAAAEPRSTLGEENRLFQEAAAASRRGEATASLELLEKLLREFPQSPLAQTALVRKFRLLAKAGRTADAAREAERYLSSYPTGFAVPEARTLASVADSPGSSPSAHAGAGSVP